MRRKGIVNAWDTGIVGGICCYSVSRELRMAWHGCGTRYGRGLETGEAKEAKRSLEC